MASQSNKTFYLDQSSLQCKAGCGFFGNPEWMGYCSICFKQLNHYHQQQRHHQLYQPHYYTSTNTPHYQSQISAQTRPRQQIQASQIVQSSHNQMISPQLYQQQHQRMQVQQQQQSSFRQSPAYMPLTHKQSQDLRLQINAIERTIHEENVNQDEQSTSNATNLSANVDSMATTASGSVLNTSNLFSNITSPTSLVMMGVDTLTNLHNTIRNTAKFSFRTSPSTSQNEASTDSASIHSTTQSEYQMRPKSKKTWPSLLGSSNRRDSSSDKPTFLYDVAWSDCLNHTNKFAKEFLNIERRMDKSINELSDLVHEFYERMRQRFDIQFIYKGASQDQLELLADNMERILNEHIYHVISARIINEDEEHNMAIQRRIRSLNWVTLEHLEIDIDFQRSDVHDSLDRAICQMVEMYSRTSTVDKLECIVQCSKTIFELLQVGQLSAADTNETTTSQPASADQFLPVLVFVVIQANPPMLPADVRFLTRFSNPRRLMQGEAGYYFTNLCCALEFIENVSGASLNMSEPQFESYMKGEVVPQTCSKFRTYLSDGLRTMCSNRTVLKDLRRRNELRQAKLDSLLEQIDVHIETNRAKLSEMETFASGFNQKLTPCLPKLYLDLKERNPDLANKLLPSRYRQAAN